MTRPVLRSTPPVAEITPAYVDGLADPCFVTAEDGHVMAWNGPAQRLLGWSPQQAIGHRCADLLAGVDGRGSPVCAVPCRRMLGLRDAAARGDPHGDMTVRLASGSRSTVAVGALPVRLNGQLGLLHILRAAGADRDALTGALTRPVMRLRAADEQAHARRFGEPLAIALADVDHLKWINDELSHADGDAALIVVARSLRGRRDDLLARWGGDEFLVLLPGATRSQAAARLRRSVALLRAQSQAPVTFSAGVSDLLGDERLDDAVARCDAALHAAKAAGRAAVRTRPAVRLRRRNGGSPVRDAPGGQSPPAH